MSSVLTLNTVHDRVLTWLETMRVGPVNYRMNEGGSANAFTSCFALFILDLLGEVPKLDFTRRNQWVIYLQSLQNVEHGYFEPEKYCHSDPERNRLQLTCFCLSALGILGDHPKYALNYLNEFESPNDIESYLHKHDVHNGERGSGNKAMFLGIALSYEFKRTGEKRLRKLLDAWFEFHDRYQNSNGFWGSTLEDHFYHGFQNALHQLVVYFYWNRLVGNLEKMVDTIISLQGPDGLFDMTPGGSACMDYDAVHILVNAFCRLNKKKESVAIALRKAFAGLAANHNSDGGFCQSRLRPECVLDIIRYSSHYLRGPNPYLWYYRLRKAIGVMRRDDSIYTGWIPEARRWDQSNLWDTWFRLLAMAEIQETISLSVEKVMPEVRFHDVPGLGNLGYSLFDICQNSKHLS